MRPARPHQANRHRATPSVALDDDIAWPSHTLADPLRANIGSLGQDRLAWPTAITVTVALSAGLWLGIGWLVSLTFA